MAEQPHAPDPELEARIATLDPALDLEVEIRSLARAHDALILAHFYQDSKIQDVADVVGDSLALAQAAARSKKKTIAFAGVRFMAETAKILCPDATVLIPDRRASCSLADGCSPDQYARFKSDHPGHVAISYVNCTAEVKALSDIICTSSNAVDIVRSFPREQKLLFAPDRFLARWIIRQSGRDDLVYWPGSCIVHEIFSAREISGLMAIHPGAEVIAHPECDETVLRLAAFVGSTSALIDHVVKSPAREFIVATEPGVLHPMRKKAPGKRLIPAPVNGTGNGQDNVCPHMRLTTLEKLYLCLRDRTPRVEVPDEIASRARVPIERMLAFSSRRSSPIASANMNLNRQPGG